MHSRLLGHLVVIATLAAAMAGCVAPDEDEVEDPLLRVCPQWIAGVQQTLEVRLPANGTNESVIGPGAAAWYVDGWPVDRYRVRIGALVLDGVLEMRAFANGTQKGIRDYRDPAGPVALPVLVADGASTAALVGHEFDVDLTAVAHGTPASPSDLTLAWRLSGEGAHATVHVQALHRVCGAPLTPAG